MGRSSLLLKKKKIPREARALRTCCSRFPRCLAAPRQHDQFQENPPNPLEPPKVEEMFFPSENLCSRVGDGHPTFHKESG